MKRIIMGWERNSRKRVYLVQYRRWCFFPWRTLSVHDKRNKALDRYLG